VDLIQKLAFEAAFVKPGSDEGLLPLNSLLTEAQDLAGSEQIPESVLSLLEAAAQQLEQVFAAGGLFSESTTQWFHEWAPQIQACVQGVSSCLPNASPAPSPGPLPMRPEWTRSRPCLEPPSGQAEEPEPILQLAPDADVGLLREFLTESAEHLQNIEQGILILEENPVDNDTLNAIFRAFHTFKGGAGFLDLHPVKDLAHELESLLDAARQGTLVLDREAIELILEGADALRSFVQEITDRLSNLAQAAPIVVPIRQTIRKVRQHLERRTGNRQRKPQPLTLNRPANLKCPLHRSPHARNRAPPSAPLPLQRLLAPSPPQPSPSPTLPARLEPVSSRLTP